MKNDKELINTLYEEAERIKARYEVASVICGVIAFTLIYVGLAFWEIFLFSIPVFIIAAIIFAIRSHQAYIDYNWKAAVLKNLTKSK